MNTADDLVVRLTLTGIPWDAPRWKSFLELSPEEQALEVQMLADSGEPPSPDTWKEVLSVLQIALTITSTVVGIATGVAGVVGAVGSIQATIKGM